MISTLWTLKVLIVARRSRFNSEEQGIILSDTRPERGSGIADSIAEAVGCDSYGRMEDSTVQALAKTALEPEALFQWLECNEK